MKFKVGDRVKITEECEYLTDYSASLCLGDVGIISKILESHCPYPIYVVLDGQGNDPWPFAEDELDHV